MFQDSRRLQRHRALIAALLVTGALLGTQAAHAPSLARADTPAATPSPVVPTCAWTFANNARAHFGQAGLVDEAGIYYTMVVGTVPGLSLRIRGRYPYARYMSITLYSLRSGVVADFLADRSIAPDPGSTNPFLPNGNRLARRRAYTVYVRPGLPPESGRARNTIYMGAYKSFLVIYRIYAIDKGADLYGSVPKPSIDLVYGPPAAHTRVVSLPACATQPVRRAGLFGGYLNLPIPMQWRRVGTTVGGILPDGAYIDARLNRDDADEYIVRFKEPTFADTYHGRSITGHEDVRYWSLCEYGKVSSAVVACLHDYQAVRGHDGYVTVVISTYAKRPKTATSANGINWLPFGPEAVGLLTYRQILPNPSFPGSLQNIAPDAYPWELRGDLGPYFPAITTCSLAGFQPGHCNDPARNLRLCSDLTEPVPCTPNGSAGAHLAVGRTGGVERHGKRGTGLATSGSRFLKE